MSSAFAPIFLRESRLAAFAAAAEPAWLWSTDAARVIWANAAGAALLGSATVHELTARSFAPGDRAASQVLRLAASLSADGAARLERLRGFGTGFLRPLTATCSRLTLADGTQGILILGSEPAGHPIALAERARRLFEGAEEDLAVFSPDGTLIFATASARQRMAHATTLVAFNANALANEALLSGSATGETLAGTASMTRIGWDASKLLVVRFAAPTVPSRALAAEATASPASEISQPAEPAAPGEVPAPPAAPVEVAETVEPAAPVATDTPAVEPAVSAEAAQAAEAPTQPAATPAPVVERQHPLRFVWQMDVDGNFTLASDDFIELIGPATAQMIGKPWNDIAATLQLDPDGMVARAIATRDTWSGVTVQWPADDSERRLKVELSGLPIYDRQRVFTGYRGFGVCRDLEAFAAIAQDRRTKAEKPPAPAAAAAPPKPAPETPAVAETRPVEPPAPKAAEPDRPVLTVVPPKQNVVPFRPAASAPPPAPAADNSNSASGLNAGERNAFSEIARQLSSRLKSASSLRDDQPAHVLRATPGTGIDGRAAPSAEEDIADEPGHPKAPEWLAQGSDAHALVDKLPLGVLIYRFDTLFYANRAFLEQVGYESLPAFIEAGGLDSLFIETSGGNADSGSQTLTITTGNGEKVPVEGRLFSVPWNGESALALILVGVAPQREQPAAAAAPAPALHHEADLARIAELETAVADAKRAAAEAAAERAELLGKITEQVRAPLSTAVSNLDTMLEERFGPIGNERYRAYLSDIRGSGARILGLFDDLASLSKVDSIKADFENKPAPQLPHVNLNEVVKASVAKMQPEASRVRVLIRTSLSSISLPVTAEPDSLSNIVTNLLTSSIRFAGTGGQVIVSTAPGGVGKVTLRLRDTGAGLSENELAELQKPAMPGTQAAPADAADEKLTMAITRAMLDANNATLAVTSKAEDGTLVEVTFPAAAA
jgi:signal transduction histidine kinase